MRNATTVLESEEAKDASRTLLNRARLGHQSSVSRFCAALLPFSEQHEATATIN